MISWTTAEEAANQILRLCNDAASEDLKLRERIVARIADQLEVIAGALELDRTPRRVTARAVLAADGYELSPGSALDFAHVVVALSGPEHAGDPSAVLARALIAAHERIDGFTRASAAS